MFEIEDDRLKFNGQTIITDCTLDEEDIAYINEQLPDFELSYLFLRIPVHKSQMLLIASHLISYYSDNYYNIARRIVSENEDHEKFLLFMLDRKGV